MVYDVTLLSNATTPQTIVSGLNQISNGLYGALTFLGIYVVILLVVSQEYMPNVLLAVSFLMSILGGVMMVLGWLAWWVVALNVTILAGAIIWKIWGGRA